MNRVHQQLIWRCSSASVQPARVRTGGAEGNERLTASTAVVLLALLAVEGVTIVFLRPLLSVHVFVGMLLIPPVALKIGSTGYRFARYYQRRREYVAKGPPHPLMRFVVAPVLVASTIGIFATGVALLAVGRRFGVVLGLHKASFAVWLWAMGIHVLVHAKRLVPLLGSERSARGALLRGGTIVGTLVVGLSLAAATLPLARPWLHFATRRDQADAAPRRAAPLPRRLAAVKSHVPESPAARALGLPPIAPGPVPGYLLIADRNANKLLIVSPSKHIVWQFPRPGDLRSGQSFFNPDDAFFAPGFRRVVTNEEFNDTVAEIDVRTHRIVWSYGRAGVPGSVAGELSNPDDAYVWRNRTVTVADIKNCRVLRLSPSGRIVGEIGTAGVCAHDPPRALLSPNGATPLPDGGLLVTEIGGYVDRLDARGRLVFSVRTPTGYPSDAQLLPNGNVLVAGFDTPGRVDEITTRGQIVWTYGPASGPGALDRPSLAVRWPNGMIAVTDDWHHRIVVVDPQTKRIVWQYGHYGIASAAAGFLSKPDGLDLLPATTARAPRRPSAPSLAVRTIGVLPAPASRLAATALPGGDVLAAGGLVSGSSSGQVLFGPPSRLRRVGRLPVPTHDAALALSGAAAYLFGGGEAVSTDAVVRIDPATGSARPAGSLGEPLSDLGAVRVAGRVYLVGGYTGPQFATAVLRFRPGRSPALVARLPAGVRYAGVAALGGRIYVAGGVTPAGESRSVLAVDPRRHSVRVAAVLPAPVAHAPLVAVRRMLYLVGGTDGTGIPLDRIMRVDPASGRITVAGHLPQPLADAAAVAVGRRVIVLGGAGTRPSRAVLAFKP